LGENKEGGGRQERSKVETERCKKGKREGRKK
jgi:hypothetical protein